MVEMMLPLVGIEEVTPEVVARNEVRWARVSTLRDAGFQVMHTPTKVGTGHCSILWRAEDAARFEAPWNKGVEELFAQCFNEVLEEESQ